MKISNNFLIFFLCQFFLIFSFIDQSFAQEAATIPALGFAMQFGITNATSLESFKAHDSITREQLAKFLIKTLELGFNIDISRIDGKNTACDAIDYSQDLGSYTRTACELKLLTIQNNLIQSYSGVSAQDLENVVQKLTIIVDDYFDTENGMHSPPIATSGTSQSMITRIDTITTLYQIQQQFSKKKTLGDQDTLLVTKYSKKDLQRNINLIDFCNQQGVLTKILKEYYVIGCDRYDLLSGGVQSVVGSLYPINNNGKIGKVIALVKVSAKQGNIEHAGLELLVDTSLGKKDTIIHLYDKVITQGAEQKQITTSSITASNTITTKEIGALPASVRAPTSYNTPTKETKSVSLDDMLRAMRPKYSQSTQ